MPAPSPITKPSRVASKGRDAVSGASLRSESAFMLANPPIAIGVTVASAPPVITTSASPYWIVRKASPIACALVAHRLHRRSHRVLRELVGALGLLAVHVLQRVESLDLAREPHRERRRVESG